MKLYYTTRYEGRRDESHALFRVALCRYLDAEGSPERIEDLMSKWTMTPLGKPSIPGLDHFSISHSVPHGRAIPRGRRTPHDLHVLKADCDAHHDHAADDMNEWEQTTCPVWGVLFHEAPCGLDIQHARAVPYDAIAARFYTSDEIASVQERREEEFFRIWARREAFRKAIGQSVVAEGPSVTTSEIRAHGRRWQIRDVSLPLPVAAAICVPLDECVLSDDPIDIEELE